MHPRAGPQGQGDPLRVGEPASHAHRLPLAAPWVISWRRKWQPTPISCLESPMDRGAWWAAVQGVTQSQTRLK